MSILEFPDFLSEVSSFGRSGYFLEAALAFLAVYFGVFYFNGKNGLWARIKKARRRGRLIDQFPGPRSYPFMGSIPEMYELALNPCRDLLPWGKNMVKKFGPFYRFWLPGQPKIVIACTETAMKHLQNDSLRAKPSEVAKAAQAVMGEGLLALTPDVHAPRKKIWLQWLTKRNVEASAGIYRQESMKLCKALEQYQGTGKEFQALDDIVNCAFRTIAYSALGEDYMDKLPEAVGKQQIHDLHTFAYNFTVRQFRPWLRSDRVFFNLSKMGRETRQCVDRANTIAKMAVIESRLLRKNGKRMRGNFPCFLDHLLDYEEKGLLNETQIMNELNVFMVAGYDTSGLTACYTLYFLSLHPEHQDKVVEELLEVFGGKHLDEIDDITPAHVKQMRYLELCIKEALRFYPILPWIFRRTTRDIELPDGRIIPEDVDVYVALDIVHRDPKYFPEPDKFIPERHVVPIPAFMPFSVGPRGCVGQIYAYQELKMILAHLLMQYRWETTEKEGLEPLFMPVLVPEHGLKFKIENRFPKLSKS